MHPSIIRRLVLLALSCLPLAAARMPDRAASATLSAPPLDVLHAELERSTPAGNDTLRAPLDTVRLEFSARVAPDLTRLVLVAPDADSVILDARSGSDDGRIIVAAAPALTAGAHVLHWRTTSADGHVLNGEIPFVVVAEAVPQPEPDTTVTQAQDSVAAQGGQGAPPPPATSDFDTVLPLLRALGTGLLLALAGGLLFASRSAVAADALRRVLTAVALVAPLAIFAELAIWTLQVAGSFDFPAVMQLATGKALLARLVLAAIALVILLLGRSTRAALLPAFLAVLVSGGIGHAAAVSPFLSVPLRAVHMTAGSVWFGGLLVLVLALRAGPAQRDLVHGVSTAALWSFGFVALTGVAQATVLLGSFGALVQTGYGRIILGKAAGLLALGAFGFHHRRLIAAMPGDGSADPSGAGGGSSGADGAVLARSATREIVLFIALIVLSAVLAFTPLPE